MGDHAAALRVVRIVGLPCYERCMVYVAGMYVSYNCDTSTLVLRDVLSLKVTGRWGRGRGTDEGCFWGACSLAATD